MRVAKLLPADSKILLISLDRPGTFHILPVPSGGQTLIRREGL